jgi:hypothetical protein
MPKDILPDRGLIGFLPSPSGRKKMFKKICCIWVFGLAISAAALFFVSPPQQKRLRENIEVQLRNFDSAKAVRESDKRINAATLGSCQNPNDIDARSHRCGGRAASERKGGK